MSRITFLGLGAMGSRMAARLLAAGHDLTVWNRSPEAAAALLAAGVTWAATPRAAAGAAEVVIGMVRDDDASREVWLHPDDGALAGMAAGTTAVESSTLTPAWVRELGAHASRRGMSLLEAPVSGSRTQAETGRLVYLVGGDRSTLARVEPLLESMGSAIRHVGPLGNGALVKLATNALLGIQVTALAEIIGMLERNGADTHSALQAMAGTSSWPPVADRLCSAMSAGEFAPQFPIELMEKDLSYALQAAGSDIAAPTMATSRLLFQQAVERGLGGINMTGIVQLLAERSRNS